MKCSFLNNIEDKTEGKRADPDSRGWNIDKKG